jgi:hypothetical protein
MDDDSRNPQQLVHQAFRGGLEQLHGPVPERLYGVSIGCDLPGFAAGLRKLLVSDAHGPQAREGKQSGGSFRVPTAAAGRTRARRDALDAGGACERRDPHRQRTNPSPYLALSSLRNASPPSSHIIVDSPGFFV